MQPKRAGRVRADPPAADQRNGRPLHFDLLERNGEDLRQQPIEHRKARLGKLLRGAPSTIVVNEHYESDGATVYKQACA